MMKRLCTNNKNDDENYEETAEKLTMTEQTEREKELMICSQCKTKTTSKIECHVLTMIFLSQENFFFEENDCRQGKTNMRSLSIWSSTIEYATI